MSGIRQGNERRRARDIGAASETVGPLAAGRLPN